MVLKSNCAKVIENIEDVRERRDLMLELYHLTLVEHLVDLITISDRTGTVWQCEGQKMLKGFSFGRSIRKNAVENCKSFVTQNPWATFLEKTNYSEERLKLYGVNLEYVGELKILGVKFSNKTRS